MNTSEKGILRRAGRACHVAVQKQAILTLVSVLSILRVTTSSSHGKNAVRPHHAGGRGSGKLGPGMKCNYKEVNEYRGGIE